MILFSSHFFVTEDLIALKDAVEEEEVCSALEEGFV